MDECYDRDDYGWRMGIWMNVRMDMIMDEGWIDGCKGGYDYGWKMNRWM